MKQLLDFNPISGEKVWFETSNDQVHITHEQDVTPILDHMSTLRNSEGYSKRGIKNDHWHYARIPNSVALEMKQKHGVDIHAAKVDWPSVLACINAHYPWLKATTKHHA